MAAKKNSKSSSNKSAFVRGLPSSMPIKDVVAKAKAAGITLTDKYVSTIRYNAKVSARKKRSGGGDAAPKRGPGRPPASARVTVSAGGLVGEIERIVEHKVAELLRAKLGAIFTG
jgi:hypothetical protein